MRSLIYTILFSSFLPFIAFAEAEVKLSEEAELKQVNEKLESLKSLSSEDYLLKVDSYRDELEKYIDHKKGVCEGEFSTVILSRSQDDTDKEAPLKLSKEEREICFRELKGLQETYLSSMYVAKRNYLIYLHEKRLKELEAAKNQAIKDLQERFNKKGRR